LGDQYVSDGELITTEPVTLVRKALLDFTKKDVKHHQYFKIHMNEINLYDSVVGAFFQ
jgi:hypothetical protein